MSIRRIINKKALLLLLIASTLFAIYSIPDYLNYRGGGPCVSGVAAIVSAFFLMCSSIVALLTLLLLNFKESINFGKFFSLISLSIWVFTGASLSHKKEEVFVGLVYFLPHFFVILLLVLYSFKWIDTEAQEKNKKELK